MNLQCREGSNSAACLREASRPRGGISKRCAILDCRTRDLYVINMNNECSPPGRGAGLKVVHSYAGLFRCAVRERDEQASGRHCMQVASETNPQLSCDQLASLLNYRAVATQRHRDLGYRQKWTNLILNSTG